MPRKQAQQQRSRLARKKRLTPDLVRHPGKYLLKTIARLIDLKDEIREQARTEKWTGDDQSTALADVTLEIRALVVAYETLTGSACPVPEQVYRHPGLIERIKRMEQAENVERELVG